MEGRPWPSSSSMNGSHGELARRGREREERRGAGGADAGCGVE
jgi:hypothetical protein